MVKKYNLDDLVSRVIEYIKQNKKPYINTYEIAGVLDVSVSYARRIFYALVYKGIIDEKGIVLIKSFEVEK